MQYISNLSKNNIDGLYERTDKKSPAFKAANDVSVCSNTISPTYSKCITSYSKGHINFCANSNKLLMADSVACKLIVLGCKTQNEFLAITQRIFGDKLYKTRLKSICSMVAKITENSGINDIKTYKDMINKINDLHGAKGLVCNSADIDLIIKNLKIEVENGTLNITTINNYHSEDIPPYLNKNHIEQIVGTSNPKGIRIRDGAGRKNAIYYNGYTAAHICGKLKSGVPFELQILGSEVQKINDLTELTRNLNQHESAKPFINQENYELESINEILPRYDMILKALKNLSHEKRLILHKYQHDLYKRARFEELGLKSEEVKFPDIDPVFHEDYLRETENLTPYKLS